MSANTTAGKAGGWEAVERERRLDRMVRWICVAAWGVTLALTACYAVLIGNEVIHALRLQRVGAAGVETVMTAAGPLVIALGVLALLVAALSTVGVFLRFRTAALSEIQLRLAALEAMLAAGGDSTQPAFRQPPA
jgi:hypothetical protein